MPERDQQPVVVSSSVVRGQFQERVISCCAAVCSVQIGVRIRVDGVAAAIEGASENALISIAKTIHFPSKISHVAHIQRCTGGDLKFWTEAGLFDVTSSLVRILGANLQLRKVNCGGGEEADRKTVFQLKDRGGTALGLCHAVRNNRGRIQSQDAL